MRVIVEIEWEYKGTQGRLWDIWGYDEFNPECREDFDGLIFWYTEGNGSCDCNRSNITGLSNNIFFGCGEKIKFKSILPLHINYNK